MYISGINFESFNEADGISCVIFFSGCKHQCKGCHSKETWNFQNGKEVDDDIINYIREEINKRPFLSWLVLSGGDPIYNTDEVIEFISKLNVNLPLWLYTGFELKDIINNKLLNMCDAVIDGQFDINKRDITLRFRGSSNQKLYRKQNSTWIEDEVL